MPENKRLGALEKMVTAEKVDPFAYYALGMEYRREKRVEDALRTWNTLRQKDPGYLPVYLMAGQLLIEQGRKPEAAEWLRSGADLAREKGDMKALGEIESALAETS